MRNVGSVTPGTASLGTQWHDRPRRVADYQSEILLFGTNFGHGTQAVDASGNESTLVTREFFYEVPAVFGLFTNGPGAVTGSASIPGDARPANLARLNIGEAYTLTAVPAKNYVFSNWVFSARFISNSPTVHFIMESNLKIWPTLPPTSLCGAGGTYNGLFYRMMP